MACGCVAAAVPCLQGCQGVGVLGFMERCSFIFLGFSTQGVADWSACLPQRSPAAVSQGPPLALDSGTILAHPVPFSDGWRALPACSSLLEAAPQQSSQRPDEDGTPQLRTAETHWPPEAK